ncbi:hypothetical protein EC988_007995, partial [Linderina pennispora]
GFKKFDVRTRQLLQKMLSPDPAMRPTMDEVLKTDVLQHMAVCRDGHVEGGGCHYHYTEEYEERKNSRRLRAQARSARQL